VEKCCAWQDVVVLMQRVKHVQRLLFSESQIISDFLELSELRCPHWFEPKPFSHISFVHNGSPALNQRLRQALTGVSRYGAKDYDTAVR